MVKKDRNSNLECLRIISMILIVMSHCDDWTGLFELYSGAVCGKKLVVDWLNAGGQIGVGCFILISGYHMVEKNVSLKKLLLLWGEVFFYSVFFGGIRIIIAICTNSDELSGLLQETHKMLFPLLFCQYWFVTAYFILMIISPFLNKIIWLFDKRTYQEFLLVLVVIFIIVGGGIPRVLEGMSGRLMPLFLYYFIAGYIRRFINVNTRNSKKHFLVAIIGYMCLYGINVALIGMQFFLPGINFIQFSYEWRVLNSPIIVIIAVELFIGFIKKIPINNAIVNCIASTSFGVYLIHSNKYNFLRSWFPIYLEENTFLVLIYSIGSIVVVYLICILIDFIRQATVEKVWITIVEKIIQPFLTKLREPMLNNSKKILNIIQRYYK